MGCLFLIVVVAALGFAEGDCVYLVWNFLALILGVPTISFTLAFCIGVFLAIYSKS